jgi:hypothetical protein
MQAAFPADHELLAFFGSEPQVLDSGLPWFYNTLDFETARHGAKVRCKILPAYGEISVRLQPGSEELARLDQTSCKDFSLVMNSQGEMLLATVVQDHRGQMFALMLEPRVWVGLGSFTQIPPAP